MPNFKKSLTASPHIDFVAQRWQKTTNIPLRCGMLLFMLWGCTETGVGKIGVEWMEERDNPLAERILKLFLKLWNTYYNDTEVISYLAKSLRQVWQGKCGDGDRRIIREMVENYLRGRDPQAFSFVY